MAPIKFEENIKEKLEKRSLQPSTEAWNVLSERLDSHDRKHKKSMFFYVGIAASIVGVLLVATMFFSDSQESSVAPVITDTEINQNSENPATNKDLNSEETSIDLANQEIDEATKIETPEKSVLQEKAVEVADISEEIQKTVLDKKPISDPIDVNTIVVNNNTKNIITEEAVATNSLTPEDAKVLEVVNQIKALNEDGTAVTEQEIDDLLKKAQKDILRDRIYNEMTRTVDADALLQDVEADLEQSFRAKVFEALKSSYKTVKTAVAERNN